MTYKKILECITIDSKRIPSGEILITVLAEGVGQKKLIVRGSQKITSKQAGNVDILSKFTGVIIERKSGFDYLIESRKIESYLQIFLEDEKMLNLIFQFLRILKISTQNLESENEISYDELKNTLFSPSSNKSKRILILWIITNLIKNSGFYNFKYIERIIKNNYKNIYFDDIKNIFVGENQNFNKIQIDKKTLKLILILSRCKMNIAKKLLVEDFIVENSFNFLYKIASNIF